MITVDSPRSKLAGSDPLKDHDPMERTAGIEPAPRAWKAQMLTVEHQVRSNW